jgi:hypothetical protein
MKQTVYFSKVFLLICVLSSASFSQKMQAQACSGAPVPGNTLSTTSTPCPAVTTTLSLTNAGSLGTGVVFQWHETSGPIAGATNPTCNVSLLSGTGTYWCDVTCTLSGLTTSSNPITLTVAGFLSCYCTSNATATQDEDIFNVTLNGQSTDPLYAAGNGCINVAPGPGSSLNKYASFLSLPPLATLIQGTASAFSIVQDDCDGPPYFMNRIAIWIDFNHNASFSDPGEQVYLETTASGGPKTVTGTFITPPSSIPGNTVMRIVCREGGTPAPCGAYSYGETEDYLVNIIPFNCSGIPIPGNTLADSTTFCAGTSANLTLQFPTPGASYQWYNGSGPIAGATNSNFLASPTVTDSFYCHVTCISSGLSANSSWTTLTLLSLSNSTSSATACDNYVWNSVVYGVSGIYTDTFMNAVGCDSVHILSLTIHPSYTGSHTFSACDSFSYGSLTYTVTTIDTLHFTGSNGCDSNIVLYIIIHPSHDSTEVHTDCDAYTFNGTLYSTSGLYTHTFTNSAGCDSIIHLDLTIHASTDSAISTFGCNAFTLNGLTYTMSGNYTQTLLNASGCDSTILLQATIDTLTAYIAMSGTGISTPSVGAYQWLDCTTNAHIAGATSLNFTPTLGGSYAVIVSTITCIDTSICVNFWPTGTNDLLIPSEPIISPNPNSGLFFIHLDETTEVLILDGVGKEVWKGIFGRGKQRIDISSFASGVYILRIKNNEAIKSYKLMKE